MLRKLITNLISRNSILQNKRLISQFNGQLYNKENEVNDASSDENPEKDDENFVIVEKDGPITLIGINSPENRNAINEKTCTQLCEAFAAFEQDDKSPVGVLYGVGGSFSSGCDLNALDGEKLNLDILMRAEGSVGPTRRHLKKPVVCGISGYCVANGLELALLCDLRVMEDTAILGFYNRRFGIPVVDGGTARLPAMIGLSRALDLILTGRQVSAKEALDFGIVNRLVATGTCLGQAVLLASSIAKFPQAALIHDRNSVYSAVYDAQNFDTAIQNEIMYTSKDVMEEMKEGIKKFKSGIGRSGSSVNIKEQTIADWEKDEIRREQEHQQKNTSITDVDKER